MPATELFVSHSWTSELELGIIFGCLLILTRLILLVLYYFYSVRRDVPQQYQVVPPVAVAPVIEMAGRAIISLPRVRYLSDMRYDTCIICLNDFIEGEELVALQCDHVFHYRCMDEWLTWGTGCPICRASTT
ncbi:hypothetical protein HS088_TW20G00337 [Tripterygium wilfordii]|uniref:RING-type domain-containing protein n=1 Tax=Tripterygium wilfordii TaxID=458696 RepID=A0A7J7C754_TRIWF|nr:hypothetical protein HS088_TW20G00337 [Tripterygium wilfordii]